jgi:hypothetical protein
MLGNNILNILLIGSIIILIYLFINKLNKEKFTNDEISNSIDRIIKTNFNYDIDSIKNLDELSNYINNDNNLYIPVKNTIILNNFIASGNLNIKTDLFLKNKNIKNKILELAFPIGCYYVQFPNENTNDLLKAFPDEYSPQKLFGGIWISKFTTESIYFRTDGNLSNEDRNNGFQDYAMKRLTGETGWIQGNYKGTNEGTGVFTGEDRSRKIRTDDGYASDHYGIQSNYDTGNNPYIPNGEENRVRNRLIRVWKRT